jgi:hypothetical protein
LLLNATPPCGALDRLVNSQRGIAMNSQFINFSGASAMNDTVSVSNKFVRVHREIDALRSKIYMKSGFWIFKSHCYTIEALKESDHYAKVYAYTAKIGDDISNWFHAGKLSKPEKNAYDFERFSIDERLCEVNRLIESRDPTWWESVKDPLIQFVSMIDSNMPELKFKLLSSVLSRVLPQVNAIKLIGFFSKKNKKEGDE